MENVGQRHKINMEKVNECLGNKGNKQAQYKRVRGGTKAMAVERLIGKARYKSGTRGTLSDTDWVKQSNKGTMVMGELGDGGRQRKKDETQSEESDRASRAAA